MKKVILLIVLAFSLNINAQVKDFTKVDNFQKTDEVLSKVVEKALIVAEKTGNFVIEQTPLLLQEFYKWHIYSNISFILLGLLIFIITWRVPLLWLDKDKCNWDYRYFNKYGDDSAIIAWVIFATGIVNTILFIFINLYNLLYLLIAPKLYLIDYFIK